VSPAPLGTDHIDIMLCHDIEFVEMQQIVDETLPALRRFQTARQSAFIGSAVPEMISFHPRNQTMSMSR
jgi:aryl-alcohol dehydrogenase-like predicted oxidoreductase